MALTDIVYSKLIISAACCNFICPYMTLTNRRDLVDLVWPWWHWLSGGYHAQPLPSKLTCVCWHRGPSKPGGHEHLQCTARKSMSSRSRIFLKVQRKLRENHKMPKAQNIETCILSICIDSSTHCVWCKYEFYKSKMADRRHFGKPLNRDISAIVSTILIKFDTVTPIGQIEPTFR